MRKILAGILFAFGIGLWLNAADVPEKVDLAIAHRIRDEAFGTHSRVMDTAFYLTDV